MGYLYKLPTHNVKLDIIRSDFIAFVILTKNFDKEGGVRRVPGIKVGPRESFDEAYRKFKRQCDRQFDCYRG